MVTWSRLLNNLSANYIACLDFSLQDKEDGCIGTAWLLLKLGDVGALCWNHFSVVCRALTL